MTRWLIALGFMLVAGAANAQLNVVATTSNMGMLAETVGGEKVSVRVLAPPDRNTHYLDVRPNMMTALRRADLVVSVGAELEIGWLPPAIQGSGNPRLNPGRSGYFEAAAQVERIGVHGIADRSMGDVHPGGNPHVYLDPVRMARIAQVLAGRMGQLDSANADAYMRNAEAFVEQVERRLPAWKARAESAPGVVLFHEDADYLTKLLDIPNHGYLEPLPGSPPTASHLRSLIREHEGKQGVIIYQGYHSSQGPDFVANALGWEAHQLPTNVQIGGSAEDYFALIDSWVDVMAAAGQ